MTSKAKLALGVTTALVAFAAATVAPEAAAHASKKAHKHAKKAHVETVETHTSSFSHSNSSNAKVDALESQLQAMQAEIRSLRAASGHHPVDPDTAKVQELDQWMNSMKHEDHHKGSKDNMVFFRGGYGHGNDPRGNNGDILVGTEADKDSWYFGAGFDWSINDNLFGMMNGTEVAAELMFDYKEFSDNTNSGLTGQNVTTNQLTLAASPKIKFLKGSAFRPWLIPAGFELSVISPPSGAVTVLNPGMMFGAGADYKIWKDIYVGADVRYHNSFDNIGGGATPAGNTVGVNPDGITAGGYLGLGF